MTNWVSILTGLFALSGLITLALCTAAGKADTVAAAQARAIWAAAERLRRLADAAPAPPPPALPVLAGVAARSRARMRADRLAIFAADGAGTGLTLVAGDGRAGEREAELVELAESCLAAGTLVVDRGDDDAACSRGPASAVPVSGADGEVVVLAATWPASGHAPFPVDCSVVAGLTAEAAEVLAMQRAGRFSRVAEDAARV
jgi:hypothetical protein